MFNFCLLLTESFYHRLPQFIKPGLFNVFLVKSPLHHNLFNHNFTKMIKLNLCKVSRISRLSSIFIFLLVILTIKAHNHRT